MSAQGLLRMDQASWRLSRIEEELDGLSLSDDSTASPKGRSLPGSREGTFSRGHDPSFPPPPEFPLPPYPSTGSLPGVSEEDIYSKAILADKDKQTEEMLAAKEAARFISEKYDSLGRLTKQQWLQQQQVYEQQQQQQQISESQLQVIPPGYGTFPGARANRNKDVEEVRETNRVMSTSSPSPPLRQQSSENVAHNQSQPMIPPEVAAAAPAPSTYNPYGQLDNQALSDQDILQVEMFYRSHKTDVFVCQCMVHMYLGTAKGSPVHISTIKRTPSMVGAGALPESGGENWTFMKSGMLVVVLDSGESRRQRKLHIILAERGTGFVLWKDKMDNLTNYTAPQPCFHSMHLSNDHTKLAGFRFQDATAAAQLLQKIFTLTSDPEDTMMRLSKGKGSKKKDKEKKKAKTKQKLPSKADISSPCCFTHVTKLDRSDGMCMLSGTLPSSPSRGVTVTSPGVKVKQI